jgi:hypothetical protein
MVPFNHKFSECEGEMSHFEIYNPTTISLNIRLNDWIRSHAQSQRLEKGYGGDLIPFVILQWKSDVHLYMAFEYSYSSIYYAMHAMSNYVNHTMILSKPTILSENAVSFQ